MRDEAEDVALGWLGGVGVERVAPGSDCDDGADHGVAVPRASLVILSGTLAAFGLPLEGVAVILGVDELMDMARNMTNVIGNCLATAVVARWEGELTDGVPEQAEASPVQTTSS